MSPDFPFDSRLPLSDYRLFRTSDVDEAREEVARVFCDHQLIPLGRTALLDAAQHSVRLRQVGFNYIRYGAEVGIVPGELTDFYVLQATLRGTADVTSGCRTALARPGVVTIPAPHRRLAMRWRGDCEQIVLRVERSAVEAELRDLIDRPLPGPVEFDVTMPLHRSMARSWWRLVRHVVADLDDGGGLARHELAAGGVEHALITGLLLAQPHNYTAALNAPPRAPGAGCVRLAVDLIENQPQRALTVSSLAREAGVSVRALQLGFRRNLDTTPTDYLRRVRLQRARAELQAGGDGLTVSEVAWRWGFTHLGRFATAYRLRYGEPPSRTLRRF
ncbi:transcriptional regulator [Actinorhabdospora filicis]|uniref:Transcriptional regulator n=1 Tax=Actinorhabdospora filicis TaxID=1785913 RepID=A0A9W6STT6_9ACTN|nr:AraC family transcriptional regulator [Actinorhabdospora filicis]GLZ81943.1 transcriptional regulator [Actinorhabdospora filicis]